MKDVISGNGSNMAAAAAATVLSLGSAAAFLRARIFLQPRIETQ